MILALVSRGNHSKTCNSTKNFLYELIFNTFSVLSFLLLVGPDPCCPNAQAAPG